MLSIQNLLPSHTNFKTLGQFENLVFVIMPARENIRLIARTPLTFPTYRKRKKIIPEMCSVTSNYLENMYYNSLYNNNFLGHGYDLFSNIADGDHLGFQDTTCI